MRPRTRHHARLSPYSARHHAQTCTLVYWALNLRPFGRRRQSLLSTDSAQYPHEASRLSAQADCDYPRNRRRSVHSDDRHRHHLSARDRQYPAVWPTWSVDWVHIAQTPQWPHHYRTNWSPKHWRSRLKPKPQSHLLRGSSNAQRAYLGSSFWCGKRSCAHHPQKRHDHACYSSAHRSTAYRGDAAYSLVPHSVTALN